jgi:hypothetical protein
MISDYELIKLGFKPGPINCIWLFGEIGRYDDCFEAFHYNQIKKVFTINSNAYDGCEVEIDDLTHLTELLTALRLL